MGPFKRFALNWAVRWFARVLSGEMRREQVEGMVRHALTALGGVLVARGVIDESLVEPLVGTGLAAFGVAWSLLENQKVQ